MISCNPPPPPPGGGGQIATSNDCDCHSLLGEDSFLQIRLGFRHEVDENSALLGYYTASRDNSLPTFRDNLSVPLSGLKNPIGLSYVQYLGLCKCRLAYLKTYCILCAGPQLVQCCQHFYSHYFVWPLLLLCLTRRQINTRTRMEFWKPHANRRSVRNLETCQ